MKTFDVPLISNKEKLLKFSSLFACPKMFWKKIFTTTYLFQKKKKKRKVGEQIA